MKEAEYEAAMDQIRRPEMTPEEVAETIRKGIFEPKDFTSAQLRPPVPEKE